MLEKLTCTQYIVFNPIKLFYDVKNGKISLMTNASLGRWYVTLHN